MLRAWGEFECSDYRVSKPYHSLDFYEASPATHDRGGDRMGNLDLLMTATKSQRNLVPEQCES